MKGLYTALVASAVTGAFAAPSPVEKAQVTAAAACATPVTLSGNPFTRTIYANKEYSKEVMAAAATMTDSALAASASKVAQVGTFLWMYVSSTLFDMKVD
jgi:cellulose 1,4-beta-cellobiosidase